LDFSRTLEAAAGPPLRGSFAVTRTRYDSLIPDEVDMAVRKVAVTLPEELYEMVERARGGAPLPLGGGQEALRTHFGEAIYVPTEDERRRLVEALEAVDEHPDELREWTDVRSELWPTT